MRRSPPTSNRWFWVAVGVICAILVVVAFRTLPDGSQRPAILKRPAKASSPPLTPIRPTPLRNVTSSARFVGSATCAECHRDEHASYMQTEHSRALGEVDLAVEPPDAQFVHAKSGLTYRSIRREGSLWHRESLFDGNGQELLAAEFPVRYAIGSGHHSRSYLCEVDGFLLESPLTWYAALPGWGMSPGYDKRVHASFELIADQGCLYCHAGNVTLVEGNRDRLQIHEGTIGCESCHGAGSLHVDSRRSNASQGTGEDLTIVHPARLGRAESEAVCARCHLRGAATVMLRGRKLDDFRPGQRLEDFRIDYVPAAASDVMNVVGHVEQMRASTCYQKSDALTCTTCHDPHAPPAASERVAYYRNRCNDCHHELCGLPREERLVKDSQDNCVVCHMPQRPTDLPHFAFTHHRIGLHATALQADQSSASAGHTPQLAPLGDGSHLSQFERDRGLGLAYLEFAERQNSDAARDDCLRHADRLLKSIEEAAGDDVDVLAGLAILSWQRNDLPRAKELAEQAAALGVHDSRAHANALLILADVQIHQGDRTAASETLQALTRLRRSSEDWLLLGRNRGAMGDLAGAAAAFRRAAAIHPFRREIHEMLAGTYIRLGDSAAAARHESLTKALAELLLPDKP
jgi:tetratricopeptide (TPR) repeat protein